MSKSLNCFYFQHSVLFWKKEISFVLLDGLYPNCLPEHSLHCRPFSAHSFFPPPPFLISFSKLHSSQVITSHMFDPESSSEEQPCICQINCSRLQGKAPPLSLQTLILRRAPACEFCQTWGFTYCASNRGGISFFLFALKLFPGFLYFHRILS